MATEKPLSEPELNAQLRELSKGASMAFANAEALFQEAALLHSHGALCRALFLHQISLEECGKIEMLGAFATSLLMGLPPDFDRLKKAISAHKAKNHANAYMLPATEEEIEARVAGDWKRSIEVFDRMQSLFHQESNTAKNASLYVDYNNGLFSAPKGRITEAMVAEIAKSNAEFLALTNPKVKMLLQWQGDNQAVRGMMTRLMGRIEELRSQSHDNPEHVLSAIMQEMLEQASSA